MFMATPSELARYIRFSLETLAESNSHHQFEQLCFEVARARIISNLMPATGPVSSKGDQGRDGESYWIALKDERSAGATSMYRARASTEAVVLACTIQRDGVNKKIKQDLRSITGRGQSVDRIIYFSVAPVPVGWRHELQHFARDKVGVALDIWDGLAIARELADRDLFPTAASFLQIPAGVEPDPSPVDEEGIPEWYADDKRRLTELSGRIQSLGDLNDIVPALRLSSTTASLHGDLAAWLSLASELIAPNVTAVARQRARFEVAWASSRGNDSLFPVDQIVADYFSELTSSEHVEPAQLNDASMLLNLVHGARLRRQTIHSLKQVELWWDAVCEIVQGELAEPTTSNARAELLAVLAYLNLQQRYPADKLPHEGELPSMSETSRNRDQALAPDINEMSDISLMDVDRAMACLTELIELLPRAPLFPVEDTAAVFAFWSPLLSRHDQYSFVRSGLDDAIERIEGKAARARRCLSRANQQVRAHQYVRALEEIHEAKFNWWQGETLEQGVSMLVLAARIYLRLDLPIAAKQYAMAAAGAVNVHGGIDLKAVIPEAFMLSAEANYAAGQSLTSTFIFGLGLLAQTAFAEDAANVERHSYVEEALVVQAHILRMANELRPSLVPVLRGRLVECGALEAVQHIAAAASEVPFRTEAEIVDIADRSNAGRPFSDVGRFRLYQWSALGIDWSIRCTNNRSSALATERVVASLQVLSAVLALHDAELIPGKINLELTVDRPASERGLDQAARRTEKGELWRLVGITDAPDPDAMDVETMALSFGLYFERSLLTQERFSALMESAFENGATHKLVVGRPYNEVADILQDDEYELLSGRPESQLGESKRREVEVVGDLAARADVASSYDREKVLANIEYRYSTIPEVLWRSLPHVRSLPGFAGLRDSLRAAKWKDWHILLAIVGILANERLSSRGIEVTNRLTSAAHDALRKLYQDPERPDDALPTIDDFSDERMTMQITVSAIAGIRTNGGSLNSEDVTSEEVMSVLARRYRYWEDDVPHELLFD